VSPGRLCILLLLTAPVACGDDSGGSGGDGDGDGVGSGGMGGDGDGDAVPDPIDPTYANIQTRVFQASCAFNSCHDDTAPAQALDLKTDAAAALVGVMATGTGAEGRVLVIPNDADNSYIVEKVEAMMPQAGVRMPVGGQQLEQNKIDALRAWIDAGATTD
jgi:hypothetical protein